MAKKQVRQSLNLFEQTETQSTSSALEEKTSSAIAPKILNPCPRCGGKSALSKRPWESGGSHYCLGGCLSEDRMDCFYFIPVKETPF